MSRSHTPAASKVSLKPQAPEGMNTWDLGSRPRLQPPPGGEPQGAHRMEYWDLAQDSWDACERSLIADSPDSCIFHTVERKTKCLNLDIWLLSNNNLLMFRSPVLWAKTSGRQPRLLGTVLPGHLLCYSRLKSQNSHLIKHNSKLFRLHHFVDTGDAELQGQSQESPSQPKPFCCSWAVGQQVLFGVKGETCLAMWSMPTILGKYFWSILQSVYLSVWAGRGFPGAFPLYPRHTCEAHTPERTFSRSTSCVIWCS